MKDSSTFADRTLLYPEQLNQRDASGSIPVAGVALDVRREKQLSLWRMFT
jgi:hypothetical protein